MRERMIAAGGGTVYPACTRLLLAFHGAPKYRPDKASEVWRIAIDRLAVTTDL